jgi:hypothetical protein
MTRRAPPSRRYVHTRHYEASVFFMRALDHLLTPETDTLLGFTTEVGYSIPRFIKRVMVATGCNLTKGGSRA